MASGQRYQHGYVHHVCGQKTKCSDTDITASEAYCLSCGKYGVNEDFTDAITNKELNIGSEIKIKGFVSNEASAMDQSRG